LKINFVTREHVNGNGGFLSVQHCDFSLHWPVLNYSTTPYCMFSFPYGVCLKEEYLSRSK